MLRIEGVRGSNPLSSTEFLQVKDLFEFLRLHVGSHRGSQVADFGHG